MNRKLVPFLALACLALVGTAAHALPPLCSSPTWCSPATPGRLCTCTGKPVVVTCGNQSGCSIELALKEAATCPVSTNAPAQGDSSHGQLPSR